MRHLVNSAESVSLRIGPWLIGLILGVIVTKAYETSVGDRLEFRDVCWLGLTLLLSLSLLYVYVLCNNVRRYAEKVDASRFHRISVHRDIPGIEGSNAFSYCEKVVNEARSSIVVVGPHFTNEIQIGTDSHSEYLEKGLDQCIASHAASKRGSTFYYRRIVQLDSDKYNSIRDDPRPGGVVSPTVFADKKLASHVRDCLNRNESSLDFNFRVYGRQFVPSFPSVLIVDDQYLFFSLPSEVPRNNDGAQGTLEYSLVIAIEDLTKEIPQLFRQIAEQFENDAIEIKKVEDDTTSGSDNEGLKGATAS